MKGHRATVKGMHRFPTMGESSHHGQLDEDGTATVLVVPLPPDERSGPYTPQAHDYSRGPMG